MEQTQISLGAFVKNWPKSAQDAVQEMIDKYGQPDEFSASQAIWHGNHPWKRSLVSREEVPHDFPSHHMDVLEQFIDYRVPLDKYDELAQFDGSVIVERTKGLISARCGGEAMNFVAINLAHDIVTGKHSVETARDEYVRLYKAYKAGEKPAYTQAFQFTVPQRNTVDPDVSVID
jgi:hypothetical protein